VTKQLLRKVADS